VDIWEFWPREREAGGGPTSGLSSIKQAAEAQVLHLFLPTNCPPNSPHRLFLSLSLSFSFSRLSSQPTSVSHACSHLFCSYFSLHITAGNHHTDCSISQFPNIMCACCTTSYEWLCSFCFLFQQILVLVPAWICYLLAKPHL
jgi:hypothetical protein